MDQLALLRTELKLRHEIAVHELSCLAEDGADPDLIDAKRDECRLIAARQHALERSLAKFGLA